MRSCLRISRAIMSGFLRQGEASGVVVGSAPHTVGLLAVGRDPGFEGPHRPPYGVQHPVAAAGARLGSTGPSNQGLELGPVFGELFREACDVEVARDLVRFVLEGSWSRVHVERAVGEEFAGVPCEELPEPEFLVLAAVDQFVEEDFLDEWVGGFSEGVGIGKKHGASDDEARDEVVHGLFLAEDIVDRVVWKLYGTEGAHFDLGEVGVGEALFQVGLVSGDILFGDSGHGWCQYITR